VHGHIHSKINTVNLSAAVKQESYPADANRRKQLGIAQKVNGQYYGPIGKECLKDFYRSESAQYRHPGTRILGNISNSDIGKAKIHEPFTDINDAHNNHVGAKYFGI